jgi:hypothetical protein
MFIHVLISVTAQDFSSKVRSEVTKNTVVLLSKVDSKKAKQYVVLCPLYIYSFKLLKEIARSIQNTSRNVVPYPLPC